MASPARSTSAFKFGPFLLSPTADELRKGDTPLKLHPQPFRVLLLLVERAGTLVTRDEIQHALWGGHTWVDFDAGINFCIRQIRSTLADDAEKPKYIETVARKGYRFIAPVTQSDSPSVVSICRSTSPLAAVPTKPDLAGVLSTVTESLVRPTPQAASDAEPPRSVLRRKRTIMVLLPSALIVVLAVAFAAYFLLSHRAPKLTQKDTVVVADFRNTTGDPVFDGALQQGLSAQLEQSPFLNLVSEAQIQQTLRMMQQPPDTPLTPQVAAEICQRTNGAALLTGSLAQIGSQYDLILKAVSCSAGELLATSEAQATGKDQVLRALSQASAALRAQLGESLATVQKFDTPLVQATTPSLDALKAYSLGYAKYSHGDQAGAIPFFQQAIRMDPDFAMAYANLGRSYQVAGQVELQLEALRKAYALRAHASERERFDIVAVYHQFVTHQVDQSIQNCELWEQSYPRDFTPHRVLGFEYGVLGRYEQSAQEFHRASDLDPQQALPYAGLIIDLTALQRFAEAHAVYQQAKARHLDDGEVQRDFYLTAFLEGNQDLLAQLAASLSAQPGYASKLLLEESSNASYLGHFAAARELFARAKDAALRESNSASAGSLENDIGLSEALIGNLALARRHALLAQSLGFEPALVFALAGDTERASKAVERLAANAPPGSFDDQVTLPELKGAIELGQGHATSALQLFQSVAPYESGWFDRYTAVYLRGQAYLLARRGQDAAAEFQKIIDHPGIVLNYVIAPLARLGLARAYFLAGDTAKSRVAYQEFFARWNDADANIPILEQARSDYSRLQ